MCMSVFRRIYMNISLTLTSRRRLLHVARQRDAFECLVVSIKKMPTAPMRDGKQ
jgi:hypothetical protein